MTSNLSETLADMEMVSQPPFRLSLNRTESSESYQYHQDDDDDSQPQCAPSGDDQLVESRAEVLSSTDYQLIGYRSLTDDCNPLKPLSDLSSYCGDNDPADKPLSESSIINSLADSKQSEEGLNPNDSCCDLTLDRPCDVEEECRLSPSRTELSEELSRSTETSQKLPNDIGWSSASGVDSSISGSKLETSLKSCTDVTKDVPVSTRSLRSKTLSPNKLKRDRHMRNARKRSFTDDRSLTCPICGVLVRSCDVDKHFDVEVERLEQLTRKSKSHPIDCYSCSTCPKKSLMSRCGKKKNTTCFIATSASRYDSYSKIKNDRETRFANILRGERPSERVTCPVCNRVISGLPEEVSDHVDVCLQQQEEEEEYVDVEGDEYEEYTWAGQTRIRATTMLNGGLAGSGFQVVKYGDDDSDLNVEEDDSCTFGTSQYTENDIISCRDEPMSKERRLDNNNDMASTSVESSNCTDVAIPSTSNGEIENSFQPVPQATHVGGRETDLISSNTVIESLRATIKEQAKELLQLNTPKCLICQGAYRTPLTSIQCWHVHCEECWLRTLGAKKLCPQCNLITSPTDLRKIYL